MTQKAAVGFFPLLIFIASTGAALAQGERRETQPREPKPAATAAQPAQPAQVVQPCPTIGVQAQPGQPVREGQRVNFIANINGGDPKVVPTIVWNTTAGSITQGHNTRRIEVDTTGAGSTQDREIRAEVWVGGYSGECQAQAAGIVKVIGPAAKFGDFGVVSDDEFKTNIEALANFLAQSPDDLYVIAYAGRSSERGFTYNWLRKIRDGLTAAGVSPRRIGAVDGGFREQPLFDFWTVPRGAEPPRPEPTVKRNEIVYPKPVPRKRP
jgi:hypothetical protein